MLLLSVFLPHLLAASLVAVAVGRPLHLTRSTTAPRRSSRLRHYWHTIRWQWLCVALLLAAVPGLEFIHLAHPPALPWSAQPALWFIVLGNILLGMYAPIVLAWISRRMRRGLLASFARVRAWLPQSAPERVGWVLLSATTGICEELLFRGFALHYLRHGPAALGLPLSVGIACLLFSIGHRYQGWRGMLQTFCLGLGMSGLFIATGSLLLPIIVHILINLRIALLPPMQLQPTLNNARPPLVVS